MVSSNACSRIERKPRAPVLRASDFFGNNVQYMVGKLEFHPFHRQQLLILTWSGHWYGSVQNLHQSSLIQPFQCRQPRANGQRIQESSRT